MFIYIYVKWCIVFPTFFFFFHWEVRSRKNCIYLLYLTRIFITEMIHFNNYIHSFLLLCDLSSLVQMYNITKFRQLTFYRWKKKNMYKNPFLFARKIFNNFAYFICVSESWETFQLIFWICRKRVKLCKLLDLSSYILYIYNVYIEKKVYILKFFENLFPLEL